MVCGILADKTVPRNPTFPPLVSVVIIKDNMVLVVVVVVMVVMVVMSPKWTIWSLCPRSDTRTGVGSKICESAAVCIFLRDICSVHGSN